MKNAYFAEQNGKEGGTTHEKNDTRTHSIRPQFLAWIRILFFGIYAQSNAVASLGTWIGISILIHITH
jgi:hypothetical protein